MSGRLRYSLFGLVVVACATGVVVYFLVAGGSSPPAGPVDQKALRRATAGPYIAFLAAPPGGDMQNRLMVAPLANLRNRVFTGLICDRAGVSRRGGICVRSFYGLGYEYHAVLFDSAFRVSSRHTVSGIPSRSRASPDGRLAASTGFTLGDSYLSPGAFATVTTIFDRATGNRVVKSLNDLTPIRDGKAWRPVDRNFWGVTFHDRNVFYATMQSAKKTYLVRGDLRTKTMQVLHANVECPAVSPDGKLIAFKHRSGQRWRFTVLDLATGQETPLAETRNIDDQQAWLDNSHVLYNLHGSVWVERADGTGRTRVMVRNAASPTVVS